MSQTWEIELRERFGDDLHLRHLPLRPGQMVDLPKWLSPNVASSLERGGIKKLWRHQLEAIEATQVGNNVVVATGTASGKSLCYQIPMINNVLTIPKAKSLYIAPTKALAHDQSRSLYEWNIPELQIATYDGDTDSVERRFAHEGANIVVTNPDMLHFGLLGSHNTWAHFLRNLQVIAVDECHVYKGVFGAHVSNILKRLIRIAKHHGSNPQIIMASATVSAPATHAKRLTGKEFVEISTDTSARGALTLALTLPRETLGTDILGAAIRRSAIAEASDALTDLVISGSRTLAFVRSRKAAETVATIAKNKLTEVSPELVGKVTSYRAGYLPEERREIERQLRAGDILGLATTTALELGVDVSGLDAVVLVGWPGTRSSFWQQVGRAGRDQQDAHALLIANDNPLDHYLVRHPEIIYDEPIEAAVCDPTNKNILAAQLPAAASELHLCDDELSNFGPIDRVTEVLDALCHDGLLKRRPTGWYWNGKGRAQSLADIRGSGSPAYNILETGTGRILGTIDSSGAFLQVHPGAIYVHLGETFYVDDLNWTEHVIFAHATDVDYSTYAREITSVSLVSTERSVSWGPFELSAGIVDVTNHVISFQKRRLLTGQILGEEKLELPPTTLRTQGFWWTIPAHVLADLEIGDVSGAAHAVEHAAIGLLPLFSLCDRWDIGGVSVAEHPDNGMCTIVIYDGNPGGAGFTHHGFEVARQWLEATRDVMVECKCEDGCPGCVQSPKCGNNNNPLDKHAAITILNEMLKSVPNG